MDLNRFIEFLGVIIIPILTVLLTNIVEMKKFKKDSLFTYKIESFKSLTLKINEMVDSISVLYPHGLTTDYSLTINDKQKLYEEASKATISAYREYVCNNIFIKNKKLSNEISHIIKLCNEQLCNYKYINSKDSDYPKEEKPKLFSECIKKNKEIEKINLEIMDQIKLNIGR